MRATETGVATGINTVVRMIGAIIGGPVGAALLTSQTIGRTYDPGGVGVHHGVHAERRGRARAAFIALFDRRAARTTARAVEVFD